LPLNLVPRSSHHNRPRRAGDLRASWRAIDNGNCQRALSRRRVAAFSASSMSAVAIASSHPFNLNPQRMLLDPGHQQNFGLLLFSHLKGIRSGDALTFRVDGQGQGQSI